MQKENSILRRVLFSVSIRKLYLVQGAPFFRKIRAAVLFPITLLFTFTQMCKLLLAALFALCCLQHTLCAQDTLHIRFGKVVPADFVVSSAVVDSDAAAVVLADIGSARLEGYDEGWRVEFKRHKRIKILNRNGFDAAKITIGFSDDDNEARTLKSLKAITYNLENGKVVATVLDEKDCFLEKPAKDWLLETFTFPNVKEGSIIEFTYSIKSSSYFHLHPWDFQQKYPVLWSEYKISIPELFNYVFLLQGYHPVFRKTVDSVKETVIFGSRWAETVILSTRWVMKGVPALREEPFTSTLENHIARIKFQLSVRPLNAGQVVTVLDTWKAANNRLLYSNDFGARLSGSNRWLKDDITKITAGCTNDLDKAKKIYAFVRDNFAAHGYGVLLREDVSLKDIYKKRSGSIAEINMLLIAMLQQEEVDIRADPVILSTRSNGLTNAVYPIMENYNYVICRIMFGDTVYYLDASQPKMGFGKLPLECYNGYARAISEAPSAVYLEPDSLHEFRLTTIFLSNNDKGGIEGYYTSTPGYYESYAIRNRLANGNTGQFFKAIAADYVSKAELDSMGIDSLQQYDVPVSIHYNLKFNLENNDILYFNPMLAEGKKENPFKSLRREYPVEMPYASDETYVLNMEVPKGYKIDELPKSIRINLNGNDGFFEYSIAVNDDIIRLRSRVVLKKAIFEPEAYEAIRNFFGYVVKKQSEMIVFKKDKSAH